jgi:two-component system, NtrC family, response regulator AtoC
MVAEHRMLDAYSIAQGVEATGDWELVVYERQQRRAFRLPESGVVSIGRAAQSDIRLDYESVSRQHARIHVPSLQVEDLGSRNGSWVLGPGADLNVGLLLDRIETEGERLTAHVPRHFELGAVLKLGGVISQVQRSAPLVHTLPVPPPALDDDAPVLEDPQMVQLYALAERTASTLLPLLILGETGVGKDVLAARVHQASPRKMGPFVRINCGALSESLLESELFGHQRGAFTGANDNKPGLFEVGQGGTVFLDEIGELPLRTQVKLLHVLETSHVTRVGATKPQRIDVRFIAATNRELVRDVQLGSFRKDLYFRINTLCLKINPLRERTADILPLVRYFLRRTSTSMGVAQPELAPETAEHLEQYSWPGNVRELKNSVERARLLCGNGPLLPQHFPTERDLLNPAPDIADIWADAEAPTRVRARPGLPVGPGPVSLAPNSHTALLEALNSCGGNQTRAAELLGISRRTLVNRLNEYNVPRPRKGRS